MKTIPSVFLRWELVLVILVLGAGLWSTKLSVYYLNIDQILYSSRNFVIPGILALGLTAVVITGEIDLSLGSTVAVGTILIAKLALLHVPLGVSILFLVVVGGLLGAVNGILVAGFGLPSLAVTLGSMGAFRGIAFIIGSEQGYTSFDGSYLWLGSTRIFNEVLPISLMFFALLVLAYVFLLHYTVYGRHVFAIGSNPEASRFSGVQVTRVKITTFIVSGIMAALSSLVWVGQYGSARADNADGIILFVITSLVLGGVDINGARGTVIGVTLSLLLLGTLTNGMGLANIPGPTQTVVFGLLLVLSVLVSNALRIRRR